MAVHSHGSEAYDLSLFEPKKAKIVSLPENKKVQKMQRRREKVQSAVRVASALFVAMAALGIVTLMITSRVQLTEMNAQLQRDQAELQARKSEYASMSSELAQSTSNQSVEDYAENVLGMQKMEPYQIQYITVDGATQAAALNEEPEGFWASLWQSITDFFTGLF